MAKYKIFQIYKNLNDYRAKIKMEKPKYLGMYSGKSPLHAIYESAKDAGIYIDCMTAELAKE